MPACCACLNRTCIVIVIAIAIVVIVIVIVIVIVVAIVIFMGIVIVIAIVVAIAIAIAIAIVIATTYSDSHGLCIYASSKVSMPAGEVYVMSACGCRTYVHTHVHANRVYHGPESPAPVRGAALQPPPPSPPINPSSFISARSDRIARFSHEKGLPIW